MRVIAGEGRQAPLVATVVVGGCIGCSRCRLSRGRGSATPPARCRHRDHHRRHSPAVAGMALAPGADCRVDPVRPDQEVHASRKPAVQRRALSPYRCARIADLGSVAPGRPPYQAEEERIGRPYSSLSCGDSALLVVEQDAIWGRLGATVVKAFTFLLSYVLVFYIVLSLAGVRAISTFSCSSSSWRVGVLGLFAIFEADDEPEPLQPPSHDPAGLHYDPPSHPDCAGRTSPSRAARRSIRSRSALHSRSCSRSLIYRARTFGGDGGSRRS